MNNVFCVDQLCSVKLAPNVLNVAQNLAVGARLNQFWKTWEALEKRVTPYLSKPDQTGGLVADTENQYHRFVNRTDLSGPATPVPYRAVDSNRKTGSPRPASYEAHSVAPQTKLMGSRIPVKGDTSSQVAPLPHKMVAGGGQCAPRSTITSTKTCYAIV